MERQQWSVAQGSKKSVDGEPSFCYMSGLLHLECSTHTTTTISYEPSSTRQTCQSEISQKLVLMLLSYSGGPAVMLSVHFIRLLGSLLSSGYNNAGSSNPNRTLFLFCLVSLFPSAMQPFICSFLLCMESTLYAFLPDGVLPPGDHGLDFDIISLFLS